MATRTSKRNMQEQKEVGKMMMKKKIVFAAIIVAMLFAAVQVAYANYENKQTLIERFKQLCDKHPTYASYASIGKSTLGNTIWIFRIGNTNGPRILWDAQMHGTEDLGSEVEYLMAKWLLESGSSTARQILKTHWVLFVPVVNVDEYRRTNARGVNINRNFVTGWGQSGSSSRYSLDYRGPYAGSEKETQAMRYAFMTYHPKFYVNTHMFGGPMLTYWSGSNQALVRAVLSKIASLESPVPPYTTYPSRSGGFAIADAQYYGACAWLFEICGPNRPTYNSIASYYYPKCLPILIAMCES
jgi:hypothetical protein